MSLSSKLETPLGVKPFERLSGFDAQRIRTPSLGVYIGGTKDGALVPHSLRWTTPAVDDTATRTFHIVIDSDSGADEHAQRLREEMLAR